MRAVVRRLLLADHPVAQRVVLVIVGVVLLLAVGATASPAP